MDWAQYGKYQLEGSQDQSICVISRKIENKAWFGYILRVKSLVKDVIEKWMEGKRGRVKPRIMMLDDYQSR